MLKIKQPIKGNMRITVKHNAPAWWYIRGKHKGIDIATKTKEYPNGIGTPIYAVANGIWETVKYDNKMGNTVILRHGKYQSVYGHLSKTNYIKGYTTIKAGDCIGYSGKTDRICFGPHLHFEIRKDNVSLNPEIFINAGKNLVNWAKKRPILKVDNNGEIQYLVKNSFVKLNKYNCWDVISRNANGINKQDYEDLLNLI